MSKITIKSVEEQRKEKKVRKINDFNKQCSNTIREGFDHTVGGVSYRFSMSGNAQMNLSETSDMFQNDEISMATWTVINNKTGKTERIDIDKDVFSEILKKGRKLVRDNISKLRDDLQPKVEEAETLEELAAITWDGDE